MALSPRRFGQSHEELLRILLPALPDHPSSKTGKMVSMLLLKRTSAAVDVPVIQVKNGAYTLLKC
jgi:hypothetical protein